MYNSIIIHYSDIGTKGDNRPFFENVLVEHIKRALGKKAERVYKRYGSIVCDIARGSYIDETTKILEKVPGIAYFSPAIKSPLEIEEIKENSLRLAKEIKFESFRISSRRSNKSFKHTSRELDNMIGALISKKLDKKVSLKNYDIDINLEISEKEAFIYCERHEGVGGLPVSASGKVVCSLSGGIDSPVAAFLLMKRGCKVVFVHAYNKTQSKEAVLDKLYRISAELAKFQIKSKLYVVPFEDIQKEIIMKVPSELRMVIYRRLMMEISNKIAEKEKAKGIVTGDSIGQVASQTLENLECIYNASRLPVFAPLIGMNKEEITKIAKKIGTYEHSIIPYPDCCSFMIAKHPETKAKLEDIKKIEESIENKKGLIEKAVSDGKVMVFGFSDG